MDRSGTVEASLRVGAAGFTGRKMAGHIEASNAATVAIAQIEDAEALDALDAIAAVENLGCLFIGRADLAAALAEAFATAMKT